MALSANTAWECRTGGAETNGGGFVTGASGVDYSQQTTAQATLTTASVVNADTTKITVSAGNYTVHANDVGNIFYLTGGTATTGRYQITAVDTGANTWTVDRSLGTTGQTCPGKMGGAYHLPWVTISAAVAGNIMYVREGTYTLTGTTAWSLPTSGSNQSRFVGYSTTRGDNGCPTIACGAYYIQLNASTISYENFAFTGTGASQFDVSAQAAHISNFQMYLSSTSNDRYCIVGQNFMSVRGGSFRNLSLSYGACIAYGNTATGSVRDAYFYDSNIGIHVENKAISVGGCVFDTCTKGIDFVGTSPAEIEGNTFYGCTSALYSATAAAPRIKRNIFSTNTTALNWPSAPSVHARIEDHNSFFGNTTDRTNVNAGPLSISTNPAFVDAGANNFTPSIAMATTSNPIIFASASANMKSYPTLGAIQLDSGGGGPRTFIY